MGKSGGMRWTPEALAEYQRRTQRVERRQAGEPIKPTVKEAKYKNRKVERDGITHDSEKEARRWSQLLLMQASGEITDLRRQVPFVLAPGVHLEGELRKKPAIRYYADFVYVQEGTTIVEDIKSKPTRRLPAYRMKRHLMVTVHNLQIKEL